MKFICEPKALADALAAVKPAVGKPSSALKAIAGVQITALPDNGGVRVIATNLDVAVSRFLSAKGVETPGTVLVSHKDLTTAVKRFAKGTGITLFANEDGSLKVTDHRREITLPGLRREDFPAIHFDAGVGMLSANGPQLADVIERAATHASKDETRPVLTGLYFDLDNEREPLIVATDSYRLGVFALHAAVLEKRSLNVPAHGLKLACKAMRAQTNDRRPFLVTVRADHRHVYVRTLLEDWQFRIIEGQYPKWSQLMPDEGTAESVVHAQRDELLDACETANALLTRNVPMRVELNGGVEITGQSPDAPSFRERLDYARFARKGEDMTIGLNPEFLRDAIKVANGPVTLDFINPLRPVKITAAADRLLLMPIRLNV